jgi:hypothetical protein
MNTWTSEDPEVFKKATRRLCEILDGNNDIREACKNRQSLAKEMLRLAGDFDEIPDDVEVFIMEDELKAGSNVVAMILPPKGELPDPDSFEAKRVWVCTWNHYIQLTSQKESGILRVTGEGAR